jgi:hypothetical protein
MPHFRVTVEGLSAQAVDQAVREAKIGAVASNEVDNGSQASGTPGPDPELESVTVTVHADDPDDARRRVADALPDEATIRVDD